MDQDQELRLLSKTLNAKVSIFHFVMDTIINLALLISSIFFLTRNDATCVISFIIFPILFFRCFAQMHDAVHLTLVKKKKQNYIIGTILGFFCFLPFECWKDIHLQHHRWSGNIDKDPAMGLVKKYSANKVRGESFNNFIWKSWLPILGFLQHIVFWRSSVEQLRDTKKTSKQKIKLSLVIALSLVFYVSCVYALVKYNLFLKFLPSVFFYLLMVEVINFPHHLDLPQYSGNTKVNPLRQYSIARSCHYPKWFSYMILNNFNYHIEHHLYPHLPWYELHHARLRVKNILQEKYNESSGNAWILENRSMNIRNVLVYNNGEAVQTAPQDKIGA